MNHRTTSRTRFMASALAVAALCTAALPALADGAAPAPAAAPVVAAAPAKQSVVDRVKDFMLEKDARGDARLKRWLIAGGGLTAMLGGVAVAGVVGSIVAVAPSCAAVGAQQCRQNFVTMMETIPAAVSPANQNVPTVNTAP